MDSIPQDQFWELVDRSGGPNACWEWRLRRHPTGYGRLGHRGYTHRIAYTLTHGPIPSGMYICHRCDNPPCCNPAHLFLGTPADNIRDREEKGRGRCKVPLAQRPAPLPRLRRRLTRIEAYELAAQVRQLYAAGGKSGRQIARELGREARCIQRIIRGELYPIDMPD